VKFKIDLVLYFIEILECEKLYFIFIFNAYEGVKIISNINIISLYRKAECAYSLLNIFRKY
jgi:hypothetical protein